MIKRDDGACVRQERKVGVLLDTVSRLKGLLRRRLVGNRTVKTVVLSTTFSAANCSALVVNDVEKLRKAQGCQKKGTSGIEHVNR